MRKFTDAIGSAYRMFAWSIAERSGGPYAPGTTTDVGTTIYSLVLWALLIVGAGRMEVHRLSRHDQGSLRAWSGSEGRHVS